MSGEGPVEARLRALGLSLPVLSSPRGNYLRARRHGEVLYLAGHGPPPDAAGIRPTGKVGREFGPEEGYALARAAGLALVATMRAHLGDLDRVAGILHVRGMVNVANGFDATPTVIDGCSDLLIELFGADVGAHTRSAIGVAELPVGLPVEIEAVVAIR